jgi:uncharacterized protein (DUF4415 family)
MRKELSNIIPPDELAELDALARLSDDQIDLSDIPEVKDWTGAKRGLFYTGPRDKIAVGVDSDLVAWFKSHSSTGEESEARINQALRTYVAEQLRKAG